MRSTAASLFAALVLAAGPAAQGAAAPTSTPGQWWRGNLHTHTLWSDGNDFPEMVAAWYRDRGYHFLALSDHNILADHDKWVDNDLVIRRGGRRALARYRERFGDPGVETREVEGRLQVRLKTLAELRALLEQPGRFLMVTGEEVTDAFQKKPIHINASNLEDLVAPQGGDSVRAVMRNNLRAIEEQERATGRPILAHLNHPNFGWAITAEDLAHVVEERFFEVFNGHPAVGHLGDATHAPVERLWDIANTIRIDVLGAPPLYGLATDDSHNYHGEHGASPGRGWVVVRAAQLEASALVAAMRQGDFYASSGVELDDVSFDPHSGRLSLRIAARAGEQYRTAFVGTRRGHARGSEPMRDQAGAPLLVTRVYSPDVGEVLASADGPAPTYTLRGDELYVRAVVTSSAPAANPAYEGAMQQAWTQPVGWQR